MDFDVIITSASANTYSFKKSRWVKCVRVCVCVCMLRFISFHFVVSVSLLIQSCKF